MRYVGQIGGNGEDGWLVFPFEGEPVAFVFSGGAMLNVWREVQDWVTDVRNTPGLNWSHFMIDHLRTSHLDKACIGIVGLVGYQEAEGSVSYLTMTRLKEGLPEAKFVDATKLIEDLRIYKSVKPGMILAFEPYVTFDKRHGLHLGAPVLVTNTGCRRLSKLTLQDWVAAE